MTLHDKMQKINAAGYAVKKTGTNPHYKSKYMTLADVLELSGEIQEKNNLSIIQYVKDGKLITRLADLDSKEFIESEMQLLLGRNDMQALGSAVTYARRYSLVTMLGISDLDDDGNKTNATIDPFNDKAVK